MQEVAVIEFHNSIIGAAQKIRPLPQTVIKLAQLVADPDASIEEIAATALEDPVLVSALLRQANSASSGARDGVGTIDGAIVRLGSARTVAIAVSSSLEGVIDGELTGYGLEPDEFWKHSRACMFVAEVLTLLCRGRLDRSVVTAAVLHDIGKIILSEHLDSEHYHAAVDDTGNEAFAERILIDIDHAEVGAMLCAYWKLPRTIVEAIRSHHCLDGGESDMAKAVFVSDFVAHGLTSDIEGKQSPERVARAARILDGFDIDRTRFLNRCEQRLEDAGFTVSPIEGFAS